MRQRYRLLLYFAIFWIVLQVIFRALFMVYHLELTRTLTAHEILLVFVHGLRMDISMSGYCIMLTSLVLTVSVFTQSRWLYIILDVLSIAMLLLFCVIVVVDLELYRHWGFRLDTTPLFYAGSEAVGSVEVSTIIKLGLVFIALFTIALFVYSTWLMPKLRMLGPVSKRNMIPFLAITASMIMVIRGSFTVAPMNTGFVYFHNTKSYANHAAINAVWNFLYTVQSDQRVEYPHDLMEKNEAEQYFSALYPKSDSTKHLFKVARPNVILFVLESFTADIVEPLGGIPGLTPNLNQLCREGILFDNFYASGDRTDKGVVAILSGYPAQPLTTIVRYPSKAQHLPFLNRSMKELGYRTSFTYGGDVDFANMRSYLTGCQFDHITSEDDFSSSQNESKWGVHDHIVFDQAFRECDTAKVPFFKVILSLSSHEPFDVPMRPLLPGKDEESLFLNSCHYTDSSLGNFIRQAKQREWWKNTVVVMVADHGHRHPGNKELKDKRRFRIPLLLTGGAIRKDSVIHTFAGQTDIANTLLAQLDRPHDEFRFSKNILSPSAKSFAVFFFNDAFGYLTPGADILYDNPGRQFLRKDGATEADLQTAKAYEQILYLDYNSR